MWRAIILRRSHLHSRGIYTHPTLGTLFVNPLSLMAKLFLGAGRYFRRISQCVTAPPLPHARHASPVPCVGLRYSIFHLSTFKKYYIQLHGIIGDAEGRAVSAISRGLLPPVGISGRACHRPEAPEEAGEQRGAVDGSALWSVRNAIYPSVKPVWLHPSFMFF